jgi:hypothetical protein
MPVFFSLKGACLELGIPTLFEGVLAEAQAAPRAVAAQEATTAAPMLRLISAQPALNWAKAEHLLFLPALDVTRPWQLRYEQGDGLLAVSGTAYRFCTVDQFLNDLTRLRIGTPLAEALCARLVQARYPAETPLRLYLDGHEKPHWTAQTMPCGRVAMLDRVMPCTHQMVVNDAEGYVLLILDRPGDHHLGRELLHLDRTVERITGRRVELVIADREANSLALAQVYAESGQRHLLTMLDANQYQGLGDFTLLSDWTEVAEQAGESVAAACWAKEAAHPDDPRCFWPVRDDATDTLQAVYTSTLGVDHLEPLEARTAYRRRWACQENVIKEMVNGANLNVNYGYQQRAVPNRRALRQQAELQKRVAVTERQLATNAKRLAEQRQRQEVWTARYSQRRSELADQLAARQTELAHRQAAGQALRRVTQQIDHLEQRQQALSADYEQRQQRLQGQALQPLVERRAALEAELPRRQAAVAAVDVNRPMFERDLEKDQIMADWQGLLTNLHHWSREQYFPAAWQGLQLETAIPLIYHKPGRVVQTAERVEISLRAYAYRPDQEAAEAACKGFNTRQIRDPAGRLIQISVAPFEHSIRRLRQFY